MNGLSEIMQEYNRQWQKCSALYKQWAEGMGVTYHELLALTTLAGAEACTPKMIAEQWSLPKQTVHSVLRSFMKRGWVVLAALREDGRGRRILLTEEGNGALVRSIGALDRRERAVLRRFGEENARRLIALTELFNRCFAEEEE